MDRLIRDAHDQPTHLIRYVQSDVSLQFWIWRTVISDGVPWVIDEASDTCEPKALPSDAQPFMEGTLKWDGCCHVDFPGVHECMLHFCGPETDPELGVLMRAVYALGPEIPTWDH